jgi:PAS domain S-box-containing protein
MMWSALPDGWIDWYNARWYEYTGQTRDEAAGWGWQAVHHPEDLPGVMRAWPGSIESGEPFEMEFRLRGADGRFRWFLTRATPLRSVDGRVVRWFGTNTDIDGARGSRLRERFFSQLGAELAGALSLDQTLRVITRRIVPEFADWAIVNLIDERGEVHLSTAYHRDDVLRAALDELRGQRYANLEAHSGTAEVLRTGDIATLDADGYVMIRDRTKDVIKSGGEWISSIDLENVAVAHPAVAEAAAIGVPHPTWSERPVLFVVAKQGQPLDAKGVLAFLDGKVAKWWLPDEVLVVAELPHTATGKVSKRTLRERYAAQA